MLFLKSSDRSELGGMGFCRCCAGERILSSGTAHYSTKPLSDAVIGSERQEIIHVSNRNNGRSQVIKEYKSNQIGKSINSKLFLNDLDYLIVDTCVVILAVHVAQTSESIQLDIALAAASSAIHLKVHVHVAPTCNSLLAAFFC